MAKKKKNKSSKGKGIGKSISISRSRPGSWAWKIVLGGCLAEVYVVLVSRFYVNGTLPQVMAWSEYLPVLGGVGLGVLAAGLGLLGWKRKDRRHILFWIGAYAAFCGAFVAVVSFLAHWNMSTLTLFSVLVPSGTVLGVLWSIYERSCSLSLTVLALAAVGAWVCYRTYHLSYITVARTLAILYIIMLLALCYLLAVGELRVILPVTQDRAPVYGSCLLAVIGMLVSVLRPADGYYAMWVLAMAAFGMGVYFTVKQL